jgi:hypothetical protein
MLDRIITNHDLEIPRLKNSLGHSKTRDKRELVSSFLLSSNQAFCVVDRWMVVDAIVVVVTFC